MSENTDRLQRIQADLSRVAEERDAALARGKAVAIGFQRLLQSNMASVQAAADQLIASEVPDAVQQATGQLHGLPGADAQEPAPRPTAPQPHSEADSDTRSSCAASAVSDDSCTGIGSGILRGGASAERPPPQGPGRQASVLLSPPRGTQTGQHADNSGESARSAYSEEELGHAHAASTLRRGQGLVPQPTATHTRQGTQSMSSKESTHDSDPRSWYHRDPRDLAEAIAASDELVAQHKSVASTQARAAARAAQNSRQEQVRNTHPGSGSQLQGWSPPREEQKRASGGPLALEQALQLDAGVLEAAQTAARPHAVRSHKVSHAHSKRVSAAPTSKPRMVEVRPGSNSHHGATAADALRGVSGRGVAASLKHQQRTSSARGGRAAVSGPTAAPRFSPNRVVQRGVSGRHGGGAQNPFDTKTELEQGPPSLALHSAVTEATRVARKMTYEVSRHAGVHQHELLGPPHTVLQEPPALPRFSNAAMVPRCAYTGTASNAALGGTGHPQRSEVQPQYNPHEYTD